MNTKQARQRPQSYYEAILQLRNISQECLNFVRNQVKNKDNCSIVKEVKLKDKDYDIFLSNQRFARSLGNRMKKTFKGEVKTSRKTHTRNKQTSKDVYRVTVLFRME